MRYEHYDKLPQLVTDKLVSRRFHPTLPLEIYNYTPAVMGLGINEWSEALQDCRGLILDRDGNVVGRPFRKFWNYEQVLDKIPSDEPFEVWEKLDGSLDLEPATRIPHWHSTISHRRSSPGDHPC